MADGDSRILVSTIEDSPGRVHVALYQGHGAEGKAMRKELSLFEMHQMHETLTKALWDRLSKCTASLNI